MAKLSTKEFKHVVYCPRCDRKYTSRDKQTYKSLFDHVKDHVRKQHPDHDPEWFETYPDGG